MTLTYMYPYKDCNSRVHINNNTVKLGNKERFDKEQIGIKEPFPVINLKNSEFCKLLRPTLKIKKKHTLGMLILSQKTF